MTTTVAVPMMRISSNGLVVGVGAVARPTAQVHQRRWCRPRGSALFGRAGPVTARQTPRLRRATAALLAIAIASRPTMLHVTHAGTRDGASAVAGPASAAPLALESLGDAEAVADGEAEEAPGLPVLPAPPLVPPPEPGLGLAVGELPDDPPPLDGVAVGEGLGEELGDDEGEEVGDDVGVAV